MQLLKFELYKIFKQKTIWITLILLLGMSYLSLDYPYNSGLEKEIYKEWEGPITQEKVQKANSEYEQLLLKEELSDTEMMKLWMFQKIIMSQSIKENVEERLNELNNENTVKANLEKQILEKKLENISSNHFSYSAGPGQIIGFEFGSLLVFGVMLLLGLSSIYSNEYSSGVDNYIFSAKEGRKPLAWAKMGAAFIYTLFVAFIWEMFSLVVNFIQYGNEGWQTSIQLLTIASEPIYKNSPYAFEAIEYHFIQLGMYLLGAIAFALLITIISSICKNSLTTFFIAGFIFVAPIFLSGVQGLKTILAFSYPKLLRVQPLFAEFKTIDIFGYPILYPVFACIIMIVLSLFSIRIILQIIKHKEIAS